MAVDTAKIGVWSHTIATDKVVWNSQLFKIFGITPSEFDYSLETFKSMVHPEDLEQLMEQQGQVFLNKPVTGLNFRIIRPNKEVRYIYASITPILDEENKLIKITGINLDVTESKIAEDALRESEKKFKSLFESSANLVLVTNLKGEILDINRLEDGYNKEDILGSNVTDYLSKSESLNFKKAVKNILKNGQSDSYEAFIKSPSNENKYWHNSVSLINDTNQDQRLLISSTDITKVKNAEKELEVALGEITELKQKLEAENIYLKEELKIEGTFNEIIGSNKSLVKVLKQVEQVAKTDTTVLVLGETGTGKELIAKAIHQASNRKDKPLVKVNCSALPAELIESELFGHEKGAFTSAINRKIGRFELANGGTIFLDEIGDLPIALQTRLLRVLQENEFERVGGETTIKVDVRVITATNRNLEEQIIEDKFRQDLYYRLNVFPITCPPLRDRADDIPELVNHFVNKFNHKVNNKIRTVHQKTIDRLLKYKWPGNIRELEHVIERAVIINQGDQLRIGNWFIDTHSSISVSEGLISLEEMERKHINKVLKNTGWKIRGKNGAAEILGLKPTTLESRMKKLNILRK